MIIDMLVKCILPGWLLLILLIYFLELGTDPHPCQESYAGPKAFSEVESQNMRNYLLHLQPAPILAITFHSYGQRWMYPFGDGILPENSFELVSLNP